MNVNFALVFEAVYSVLIYRQDSLSRMCVIGFFFLNFPQQPLTEECQDVITFHADSLQYRLPKLTKKMKKVCVTVTESNSFLSLLESLDQFTG